MLDIACDFFQAPDGIWRDLSKENQMTEKNARL